jgi:competence protein ComEA
VPRPPAPDPRTAALADRFHRWREEPWAGAAILLVVAVAAGAFWFRSAVGAAPEPRAARTTTSLAAVDPVAATTTTTTTATAGGVILVHVAGAVASPGVVTLRAGARVIDAIDAAGGANAGADLDRLNLAAPLADGDRVAVARRGEPPPALDPGASPGGDDPGSDPSSTPSPGAPVNLNTATQAELEALPGIGPALAQAILAERERSGGFRSVDDLERVRGIGELRLEQLRDLVTV